jgi:L-seryl-tRNA(Ser) seleniumtransferase
LCAAIAARVSAFAAPRLRRVINLTGTVLHTNLGRAPLPEEAIEALMAAAAAAAPARSNTTSRPAAAATATTSSANCCANSPAPRRHRRQQQRRRRVPAAQHAGAKKEVIVSRGELIEIGGAFRVPDIMQRAGCRLVEVGTTNRTHLKDFANAITAAHRHADEVHASNYAIQGFTPPCPSRTGQLAHASMAALCRRSRLRHADRARTLGPAARTDAAESIAAGADLVSFSGDKLLGGPQAGLLVGRKDLIAQDQEESAQACAARRQDHPGRARSRAAPLPRPGPAPERLTRCSS